MAALGLSLGVNLMVRVFVSGSILGSYAEGFFRHGIAKYFSNLPKIVGRLFIPPNQDTASMVLLFCIVIGLLTVGVIYFFRKSKEGGGSGYFIKLGLMLTISAVIPLVFDVSTKTSESDRFLYFPSIFVCCCIALLVVRLFYSSGNFYLVVCLMLAFNVFSWRREM